MPDTSAPNSPLSAEDVLAIHNLRTDYAAGSDALAAGREDEGRAAYRAVFTPDARISAAPIEATGPDDLADQVLAAVAGASASQHLVGSVRITPGDDADHAGVRCMVQATIVLAEGGLLRVLANYDEHAVRTPDGWRLSSSATTTVNVENVPLAG